MNAATEDPTPPDGACTRHEWAAHACPVHYDGGNRTHHVTECAKCGVHGVVVRYSNRKSRVCAFRPEQYATPLGLAVLQQREREEHFRRQCI